MQKVDCPHCGMALALNPALAGRMVACPKCRQHLQMPAANAPPVLPPSSVPPRTHAAPPPVLDKPPVLNQFTPPAPTPPSANDMFDFTSPASPRPAGSTRPRTKPKKKNTGLYAGLGGGFFAFLIVMKFVAAGLRLSGDIHREEVERKHAQKEFNQTFNPKPPPPPGFRLSRDEQMNLEMDEKIREKAQQMERDKAYFRQEWDRQDRNRMRPGGMN